MAYTLRAAIKTENFDYQGAINDYTKALYIYPKNADTFVYRALVKSKIYDDDGAIADYNQAEKINPEYAAVYFNRALIYAKQNKNTQALSDMTKAKILFNNTGDTENYNNAVNFINQRR